MKARNPRLLAAAIGAALSMTHVTPVLATTTTAVEFTHNVVSLLNAGDLVGARALLLKLHALGVKWIRIDGKRIEVETLIDELRGSHPKPSHVAGKLSGSDPAFVWCDGFWRSKTNLNAPPAGDMFPTGSAGCP